MSERNLAEGYIAFANADEGSVEYERNFWAFNTFCDLCISNPEGAWSSIREILDREPGRRVLELLAAGPMEELLQNHGAKMIGRIENAAREDSGVAILLGGVWQADIEETVWRRIEAVRSGRW